MRCSAAAPQPPPLAPAERRVRLLLGPPPGIGLADALVASLPPAVDLLVDVPRARDHGRAALQLPPRLDHAPVEALEVLPHGALGREPVEFVVQLRVLRAQQQRRRPESGQLLALDLAADP